MLHTLLRRQQPNLAKVALLVNSWNKITKIFGVVELDEADGDPEFEKITDWFFEKITTKWTNDHEL